MNLDQINISKNLKDNILKLGYTKLTKIQEKIIPIILNGKNVMGESGTGTGKTASFLIPILEKIEINNKIQALILTPTRELAMQISEEAKKIANFLKIKIYSVYGGKSIEPQISVLKKGINVLVGTPGRIIDHLNRKTLNLSNIIFFVLDEVDEMINKGFLESVEEIMKFTPEKKQTLVFSATMTPEVKKFTDNFLKEFELVVGEKKNDNIDSKKLIDQYYINAEFRKKDKILLELIENRLEKEKNYFIIIFANTRSKVEDIWRTINRKIKSNFIHSNMSQYRRNKIVESFKKKEFKILVATDVMARGIHINGINLVINYDFPQNLEFYIHRIGRTGRAGVKGEAITIITKRMGEDDKLINLCKREKYNIKLFNLN